MGAIDSLSAEKQEVKRYLDTIKGIPFLTYEEERALLYRLHDGKDVNAAHKLVSSHLKLVVKIVYQFGNYGVNMMDMISEGNIGLMKAVKNFKLFFTCRLATYARHWIKSSINEYIMRTYSLMRIGTSRAHRRLFFNLRKLKNRINALESSGSELEVLDKIADQLSLPAEEVYFMDQIMKNGSYYSLNAKVNDESEVEVQDMLQSEEPIHDLQLMEDQEKSMKMSWLKDAIGSLDSRHREIIESRYLLEKKMKLSELAEKFAISRERVRQIEASALKKIRVFFMRKYETIK
ncbi:MAG: RNA polymerase sigma-32 factor [Candidatus Xenolissoclinum pacificiensis L6]|uniref:RNA polymerase sigma-32 factor n=1 Tax=Candidatus Xenolissoclinum pacificiensis L6 TaxID=1401685 RepID=W2V0S8_9RICK|nr:MAG: RNA polymerase sigma-32 factor [Candidatus Xenolissoclinum pacificiensis L6]